MISAAIRAEAVAYDAITDGCFPIITNDTVMTPAEVLLLCHFLAMLAEALIEREIRTSMKNAGLTGIPLYPELRNCPDPSAPRILEIFSDIQRHHLISGGQVVQTFEPRLTPLQQQVRDLLHIPASVYTPTSAP